MLCRALPECKYFYADPLYCTLFSKKVVKCDGVAGPPEPSQSSCDQSSTTTTLGE